MKYNELKRLLQKFGCYEIGTVQHGHPVWYSPTTGKTFQLSHHGSNEVAIGTLNKILKDAGLR